MFGQPFRVVPEEWRKDFEVNENLKYDSCGSEEASAVSCSTAPSVEELFPCTSPSALPCFWLILTGFNPEHTSHESKPDEALAIMPTDFQHDFA